MTRQSFQVRRIWRRCRNRSHYSTFSPYHLLNVCTCFNVNIYKVLWKNGNGCHFPAFNSLNHSKCWPTGGGTNRDQILMKILTEHHMSSIIYFPKEGKYRLILLNICWQIFGTIEKGIDNLFQNTFRHLSLILSEIS